MTSRVPGDHSGVLPAHARFRTWSPAGSIDVVPRSAPEAIAARLLIAAVWPATARELLVSDHEDDLEHAADQLADPIAWAPEVPELLAARAGGEVADLFPLREPAFIGTVVAPTAFRAKRMPVGGAPHMIDVSQPQRTTGVAANPRDCGRRAVRNVRRSWRGHTRRRRPHSG
jgi:hypothetical protein